MRILKRLPLIAALGGAAVLAMAAPALAAAPAQLSTTLTPDCLPEAQFAALLPVVGIGAVMLLRRRHSRTD